MKKIILICFVSQGIYANFITKLLGLDKAMIHYVYMDYKAIPDVKYEDKPYLQSEVTKITEEDYSNYNLPRIKEHINFKSGSKEISSDSFDILRMYGSAIEDGVSGSKLIIEGHTDSIGDEEYNMQLSYDRANEVKKFLVSFYDISPDRLIVKAYGESRPIATNITKEGRRENRRVEFVRIR